MSSREWRLAAAFLAGVSFDLIFFWKFQPYSTRQHSPEILPWYSVLILTFLAGLLLTLRFEGKKRPIAVALFVGFSLANACLIVADCIADPTNHNLWPFEFVMIALGTAPAFLGAGVSAILDRNHQPAQPQ